MNYSDPYGLEPCHTGPSGDMWCPPSHEEVKGGGGQIAQAIGDFIRNYRAMREASTIGADKYFHCKANCEATKRGKVGELMAKAISIGREIVDMQTDRLKGRTAVQAATNAAQDMAANKTGQSGARANPDKPCEQICQVHRPKGLPERY